MAVKEEWMAAIRDSCEYVRQFFDGLHAVGFNQVIIIIISCYYLFYYCYFY